MVDSILYICGKCGKRVKYNVRMFNGSVIDIPRYFCRECGEVMVIRLKKEKRERRL